MPTEPVDSPENPDNQRPQALADVSATEPRTDRPANEDAADDTPEYPLSAPIKPDDPERLTEQSKAETAGLVEEAPAPPTDLSQTRPSFKLALGSAVLIALSLGFELGRQVSQRR